MHQLLVMLKMEFTLSDGFIDVNQFLKWNPSSQDSSTDVLLKMLSLFYHYQLF